MNLSVQFGYTIKVNNTVMAKAAQFFNSGIARMNTRAGINIRILGTKQVMSALNKKIAQLGAASYGGLIAVATHIKNDMDATPPLIPIDTGALRAAFKIVPKESTPRLMKVEIGWPDHQIERKNKKTGKMETVDQYAAYVHEMTSPPYGDVKWTKEGSGPKFFEASIKRNANVAVYIMQKHIQSNTKL
jgi:hypothetical protein